MKIVLDMVNGIRTIKTYTWENHCLEKIKEARKDQTSVIKKTNVLTTINMSLLSNIGLFVVLLILLPKWFQNEELKLAESFALLALISYLFTNVNMMALYAVRTLF